MGLRDAFNRWAENVPQEKDYRDPAACEFKLKAGGVCGRTQNVINVNGKMLCTHNNHHKRG